MSYENHPGFDASICVNRITVTAAASSTSANGYACSLSGGHCLPSEDCGHEKKVECELTPDYDKKCDVCDATPTVVFSGAGHGNSGLCGPCCFGTAEAIDPEKWGEL